MFKAIIFMAVLCSASSVFSQNTELNTMLLVADNKAVTTEKKEIFRGVSDSYYSQTQGVGLTEIVRLALQKNGEITIARLEIEKAKARLDQAGLRSNPTLNVEQMSGRLAGSPGDSDLSVGISIPLDVSSERKRRIDVAKIDIMMREAELSSRERLLTGQVMRTYVESLSALSEIQMLDRLIDIDAQTVVTVQIRVNEGDVSPLELSLLQSEIEALKAKRSLTEARLQSSLATLKFYMGLPVDASLKLNEDIETAQIPRLPSTVDEGVAVALSSRPEIRFAELEQLSASAGLRLINSQSRPDVTAQVGYAQGRSAFDDPRGPFAQRDRSLTFGVSIGLPLFDRKQGDKAEARISIVQASERKAFAESVVKNEIASLYQKIRNIDQALSAFRSLVLPRSQQNIDTIRQVYEIGEVRITDLIAEQRKLLQTNRDMTEALTERYRAQTELFIALGLQLGK